MLLNGLGIITVMDSIPVQIRGSSAVYQGRCLHDKSSILAVLIYVDGCMQVHTIAPTESGAQLLLLGHRRLKRTSTVSIISLTLAHQMHAGVDVITCDAIKAKNYFQYIYSI